MNQTIPLGLRAAASALKFLKLSPLLVFLAQPALAWGPLGHRIISDLAEPMLAPATAGFLRAVIGNQSLADAAIWPDEMRANPSRFWQQEAGPYHYVTVLSGEEYGDMPPPSRGDAVTALIGFREVLADSGSTPQERQLALRFSVHIVQDLHQPLHVGNGRDRGGTRYWVIYRGERVNLHRLWDTEIIMWRELDLSEWQEVLGDNPLLSMSIPDDNDPLEWIAESQSIRETIYPVESVIGEDYMASHQVVLEERLVLAARRSAAYLSYLAALYAEDRSAATVR